MESSLNIQKIVKPSFAVIGIEGSTDDGEGFIPMLWSRTPTSTKSPPSPAVTKTARCSAFGA